MCLGYAFVGFVRTPGLLTVAVDGDLPMMGMLADRRDELGQARTRTVNRLHRLLLELFPGGVKQFLSARQARTMIATIGPRDLVGKTRRRLAVELIGEVEQIDAKMKTLRKELTALVTARGSTLLELTGIGPSGAARLLADVGDIHRFADGTGSPRGTGPRHWTRPRATSNATGSPGPGTSGSTEPYTSWRSSGCDTHRRPRLLRRAQSPRHAVHRSSARPRDLRHERACKAEK